MDNSWTYCEDLSDYIDYLVWVILCSPDEFPVEHGEKLDLETAFQGLRSNLEKFYPKINDTVVTERGNEMFAQAYEHYKSGRIREANDLMVDFEYQLRELQKR